jgi:voltage-gated potassium channel
VSEAPESKLLRRAKTPEDAAALVRFDGRMALPLVLAALLPIVLMPGEEAQGWLVALIVIASWVVFLADFVVHYRRITHYLGTWWGRFDLGVVILTAPWFLFADPGHTKFVMLVRVARLARVVLATGGARRLFERLGRVAIFAGIVLLVGAAIAYHAEHATNPGFATFGDALWWGIVTLTTVGYGDIVPETTAGRAAGVMIMVSGVAVLGMLAGSLASFFRLDARKDGETSDDATTETPTTETPTISTATVGTGARDAVAAELALLRAQIAYLAAEIARLRPTDDGVTADDA